MMVSGMIFCFVSSLMSYRVILLPKYMTKYIHALLHTAALLFVCIGLSAVIIGNNYTDHYTYHVYTANLYSLHSLLGLTAVILYFCNYLLGGFFFLTSYMSVDMKKLFKPNHIYIGVFTLFAAAMAAEAGIMELATEVGCHYGVTRADWNPAQNYHKLPDACKLSNGIGLMIFITVLFAGYALLGPGVAAAISGGGSNNITDDSAAVKIEDGNNSVGSVHSVHSVHSTGSNVNGSGNGSGNGGVKSRGSLRTKLLPEGASNNSNNNSSSSSAPPLDL